MITKITIRQTVINKALTGDTTNIAINIVNAKGTFNSSKLEVARLLTEALGIVLYEQPLEPKP
jgi:hypothetical protein